MNPYLAYLEIDHDHVEIKPVVRTQYCSACDCTQSTLDGVPCWQCGGTPSPTRPVDWPAQTTMSAGPLFTDEGGFAPF